VAWTSCLVVGLTLLSAAPPVAFQDGFPVTRRDQIFPHTELKRGDLGIGYTVFAEDQLRPFQVEVLGIMRGMLGPGQDVVLTRLSGPEIEKTGVIAGMSGSPVYFDGKLLGAVAYRFGAFTKEPIAGITPISGMLGVAGATVDPPLVQSWGGRGAARGVSTLALRERSLAPRGVRAQRAVASAEARPIDTPLVVSGLEPEALNDLREALAGTGLVPVAGGGSGKRRPSSAGPRTVSTNQADQAGAVKAAPIAPGSPIAALLMTGDVDIAAIGTVTMVEGDQVYAFGHPFLGGGHVDLPMATASILNTLASEAGSYKQGAPAREVGVVRHDRLTAIAGTLGQSARLVPVQVTLRRPGAKEELLSAQVEIVESPDWLPVMLETIIGSVAARRLGYEPGGTVELLARIEVDGRTLEIRDTYAAPPPLRISAFAARDVANLVAMIADNELVPTKVSRITVDLTTTAEVQLATLIAARPARTRVKAGTTLPIYATLRPFRGPDRNVVLSLPIPKDVEGPLSIEVGGGVEIDRRDAQVWGERFPANLDELLGILSERRQGRALHARSYPARLGARAGAELYLSLPPSQRATLLSQEGPTQKPLTESLGEAATLPLDLVVFGNVPFEVIVER
jgi:hypothetical protein